MTSVRDGIEQAVLISIGAAAITRERAEAAVADLVRRGQIGSEEGKRVVDRLMNTVRAGEGSPASGFVNRIEGGMQGVLREFGVATRAEHDDVTMRLAELEHRIALLEKSQGTPAGAPGPAPADGEAGNPG
jgi:polyhydroxyalkanoate synthesis regulator phasin